MEKGKQDNLTEVTRAMLKHGLFSFCVSLSTNNR